MKKMLRLKSLSLLLIALFLITGSVLGQQYKNGLKQGAVRVKFKPQISATLNSVQPSSVNGVLHTGIQAFDRVNSKLSAVSMKRVFPYSAKNEAKHKRHGLDLWYEVTYTSGLSVNEAVSGYANLSEIGVSEPIVKKTFAEGPVTYEASTTSEEMPFNDEFLHLQWHYNNTGEVENMVAGADINLFNAWKIETGKPNVVVAIVDGGIDTDHQDLAANVWINQAEANGTEGVDDDGNGYVDDIHGYNFANNRGEISDQYHGTHVAGTVGAVTNNRYGVAGVAGGSGNGDGVRLMSSQIFSATSTGGAAAAIVYGADNGAVIAQNSWGYPTPGHYEQAIHDAIDYFIAEAGDFEGSPMKGGIVFFAAGNDDDEGLYYPGCYESAISVSALGPNNKKASYSNYGTWLDIAAPGGDTDLGDAHAILSTMPDDLYGYLDGTSMACPHVSGIAALVVSKFGGPSFTNEDLKAHILTAVHDVDELNPEYVGKLGLGYIDALMALGEDTKTAPNTITDFTLVGISQDFANLTWTVPADEDDVLPANMEIIYSTEEITVDNVDGADKFKLKISSTDKVGTFKELELQDLSAETTYFIAIRSIDRWGNISALSNMLTGTTNAGPAINTDKSEFDLTIDVAQSTSAEDSFTILNEADGVLHWNGLIRHKTHYLAYNTTGLNYPEIKATTSSNTKLGFKSLDIEKEPTDLDITTHGNFYEEMYYGIYSPFGVQAGIEETSSSATRFKIDSEEGFNLTEVRSYLGHTPSTGPMIMEIYHGEEMNKNNLIFAQEVSSYQTTTYEHRIQLEEQLYFEKGSVVWVVFHIPAGNELPFGAVKESSPEYSDNCFVSTDLGNSWENFAEVYGNKQVVWTTKLISTLRDLGDIITLDPASGTILANDAKAVNLSIDASRLKNGNYQSNVLLQSNDTENPEYRVPISFKVEGQIPVLKHDAVIDFGSVFNGRNKWHTFVIQNVGFGNLNVKNNVVSDDQFFVETNIWRIPSLTWMEVMVKFTPNSVGPKNATITLTDQLGKDHIINLYGNSIPTSDIVLTPSVVDLGDMAVGETASTSFVISNDGEYPLEYVIPSFAPDKTLDGMDNIHKAGYSVESNLPDFSPIDFVWEDISATAKDVTSYFKTKEFDKKFKEVELGFEFPFYGKKYDKIFMTRYGAIGFSNQVPWGNCFPSRLTVQCTPETGIISAFYKEFDLNLGGEIKYSQKPGKFIIEYTNVLPAYEWNSDAHGTFQMVLFHNGDIEFRYKDIEKLNASFLTDALIAIGDPFLKDPLLVSGFYEMFKGIYAGLAENESIIRFKSPGDKMITSVSEPFGILGIGESKTIDVELSTEGLYESNTYERLIIATNDPQNNPAAFTVKVNVNSGGELDLSINKTDIDFGAVFQAGIGRDVLVLSNDGTKDVVVTAFNTTGDRFIIGETAPLVIKPKSRATIPIETNTENLGDFNDVLTIETDSDITFEVSLAAKVLLAPGISVDLSLIEKTLDAGDKTSAKITVANDGEAPLELLAYGNEWLYNTELETSNQVIKDFSYYAVTNKQDNGPVYNWEDIRHTGTIIGLEDWGEYEDGLHNLWYPVALPYEIEFYQQKTDTIWLSWQGVISMSKPTINEMVWPDPLLSDTEPNNIIAPYFAQQNFDYYRFPDVAGTGYQIFDDRVIVQWSECQDGFGAGDNYSFQAILYKNGTIKFQYDIHENSLTHYGAVGVKNADGTDAVQLAYMQNYLIDGLAVALTPCEKVIIPVGGEKEFSVTVDAQHLNKGVYNSDFTFVNNTPLTPELKVPFKLTVNGDAAMEASVESFDFGTVMAYEVIGDFGPEAKSYLQEFTIKNTGRDKLTFTDIRMEFGSEATCEIFYNDPWFGDSWVPVSPWYLVPLQPGESAEYRVNLHPSGANADVVDNVIFSGNLPDGDFIIPVAATVILPPVLTLDQDTISVIANSEADILTRTFEISNVDGKSTLDYELGISYNRKGEDAEANSSAMYTVLATPLVAGSFEETSTSGSIQTLEDETYNAVLEYDEATEPSEALGFGGGQRFIAATAFNAPAEGFNLTHVKTWYHYEDVLESTIKVEIRAGGTSVVDAKVLYSESFDVNVTEPQEKGEYFTFELSENQIFFPGETFYLVFEFEADLLRPQGMAGVETVTGRFTYSDGTDWGDIQAAGFSDLGWMMKAMEKEHKTRSWAVIDGATSGSVAAGESVTVNVNFLASDAVDVTNDAILTVSTNDPVTLENIVNLNMRINQGPEFTLESDLSIKENESLSFEVTASDFEGDVCTYALDQAYEFIQMTVTDNTLSFVYTPDYESAGMNSFFLTGTDSYGNATKLEIAIEVVNVNRAPEVINTIATREYYEDGEYDEIDLINIFVDPDGDELTYTVNTNNDDAIDAFISGSELIIRSLAAGDSKVTVTAVDTEEMSGKTQFDVIVGTVTGIEDVEGTSETKVYPVPTSGPLNIVLGNDIEGDVSITILNVIGVTQYQTTVNKMDGEHIERLNISNMPSGIYLVKITSAKGDIVKRVVKI